MALELKCRDFGHKEGYNEVAKMCSDTWLKEELSPSGSEQDRLQATLLKVNLEHWWK
jgi:hypothetical protein